MARPPTWIVRTQDTAPPLTARLGVDLTGASVVAIVNHWSGEGVHEGAASVVDAAQGDVSLPLDVAITDNPGLYSVSWTIVYPDLEQQTLPAADRSWLVVTNWAADGVPAS